MAKKNKKKMGLIGKTLIVFTIIVSLTGYYFVKGVQAISKSIIVSMIQEM